MSIPAPRWDLTNVFPSIESTEFQAAFAVFNTSVADLGDYFVEVVSKAGPHTPPDQLGPIVGKVVESFNAIYKLSSTLEPYIYSFVSTDSHNKTATQTLSKYEQARLPLQNLDVQLKAWLGKIASFAGCSTGAQPFSQGARIYAQGSCRTEQIPDERSGRSPGRGT